MTRVSLSADWLDGRAQYLSVEEKVDRDLLLHYIYKSALNSNVSCPFNNSMTKCLDIGYSSGYWMMEMATDYPLCQFYGIDVEPSPPDLVYPPNCHWGRGDYKLKELPYLANTFDMVNIRPLSGLGTDQILHLLSEVSRVTKRGGYVQFIELDYNSETSSPLLGKLMKILFNNKNTDRQVDDILTDFGFVNIKSNKVPIPLNRGTIPGEFSMAALKIFVESVDPRTKSKLNVDNEDDLFDLIVKECEDCNSQITLFSGFAQKS